MSYMFRSFHLFNGDLTPSVTIITCLGQLELKVPISEGTRDKILQLLEMHIDAKLGVDSSDEDRHRKIVDLNKLS